MLNSKAKLTALGTYVPERILTNADLEKLVETSDEWIVQRTGMRERRIAAEDQYVSDLCIQAIKRMVNLYNVNVDDVDMIIVATSTPDYYFPSTASRIQAYFNIPNTGSMDVSAACAGFAYGLHLANGLITGGLHRKVLVIGAETLSKITDYTDRTTCVLFGDGAGVALVEYDEDEGSFLTADIGTFGQGGAHLYRAGLSNYLDGEKLQDNGFIAQNGREVYKWAVRSVPAGIERLMDKANMEKEDLDWFVPHSANLRMIESICEKSTVPLEKTLTSVEFYGNTSAASIPLALQCGLDDGRLRYGQHVVLYGFGGGLTYAGLLIKWSVPDL
ncbi:3-oxoacyl-ACP synthase [Paenibacillus jamilae]|uniref:3-oxoacyl-ACP synthase n=1 Tax=Paenibacillus jamilae TaxID=114136 RepID=A0ACC4ZYY4_9BACL|nr:MULTISPECIES: ketoacyl-ACP synthase III [Paenibacillus]AUO05748.1 ketoacyl-ACP synthase III [Paenibacillus sp. lzh-N1]KTS83986.1 3-oxoacyl-ACP synthase [Paenibacillus jamilae]